MNATESRLLVQQSLDSFRPAPPVFAPVERPTAVTVVCTLGFAQCAVSAIVILAVGPGALVLLFGLALVAAQTACLSGLWQMRAWSLPAYVALMILFLVLAVIAGAFSVFNLLLPIATIIVGLMNSDDLE